MCTHFGFKEAESVLDRHAFQAKLELVFGEDEALFGLGSHEEGYGNLRGKSRELYQHNLKAVIPYFVSTKGYGMLIDCYSLMTFHDDALGSYIWADVVDELDYYFIRGEQFDDITRGYHALTGRVPIRAEMVLRLYAIQRALRQCQRTRGYRLRTPPARHPPGSDRA